MDHNLDEVREFLRANPVPINEETGKAISIDEYLCESLESSKFMKRGTSGGYYLTVGFSLEPARSFYNSGLRSALSYNLDISDGWFRKIEGSGKGYGLMIRDVRPSGKKMPMEIDGIGVYPVNITYLPIEHDTDDPSLYKKTQAALYINSNIDPTVTVNDVLAYVNKHKSNWVP